MGSLRKDKSLLELQLGISQREKALALESITTSTMELHDSSMVSESQLLLQDIDLAEVPQDF
jgi:hypothetical protein